MNVIEVRTAEMQLEVLFQFVLFAQWVSNANLAGLCRTFGISAVRSSLSKVLSRPRALEIYSVNRKSVSPA